MKILLPNDRTLTGDGKQFLLHPEGVTFTNFDDMARGLVQRDIITEAQKQTCSSGQSLIEAAAQSMMETWLLSHANAVQKNAFVLFGPEGIGFVVIPNPLGGWVLLNTDKAVKRLSDNWNGQGGLVVGYVGSLEQAFKLAVRRAFHAQDITIPYSQVNQQFFTLAESMVLKANAMTGDPFSGFDILPWKKPDAEWSKNHPDLPLNSSNYPQLA